MPSVRHRAQKMRAWSWHTPCPCSSASVPVSFRNDRNWPPIRLLAYDGLTRIAERVRDRPKQSSELPDNPLGLPAVSAAPRAVLSEKLRGAGRARPPLTNAQ